MGDRYLSIKDFANAAGVSVQSVYKRLNQVDNSLNQYLNQIDGKKMLNIQALQDIYGIKVEQPVEQPLNQNIQPDSTSKLDNDIYKVLLQQLDILQEQLQVKDQQISDLNNRLQDSLNLLDQQQKLTAVAEQKILQLEHRDQEPDAPEQSPEKRWWQKFFAK